MSAAGPRLPTEDDSAKAGEWSAVSEERFRPPFFPRFQLCWAIQYIHDLYRSAECGPVSIADAAAVWDLDPQSTEALERIDALLAFGLLEQRAQGRESEVWIGELGRRVIEHPDQAVQHRALAQAARKPELIAHYIERWGAARPADEICISELQREHGLTEADAKEFVQVFDGTAFLTREPQPYEPQEPSPMVARRSQPNPAQNPWTKWRRDIEAFSDAA